MQSAALTREIERRPLIGVLCALIAGLVFTLVPASLFTIPALLWIYPGRLQRLWMAVALALGLILSVRPAPPIVTESPFSGEVIVQSCPRLYEDASYVSVAAGATRLRLRLEGRPFLALGDRLHVVGEVKPLADGASYQLLQGVQGRLSAKQWRRVQTAPAVCRWAEFWRRSFVEFSEATMPMPQARVAQALCFNLDTLLDDPLRADLQDSGTVHIVSASGLHVFVLAIALLWSLSRVPVPRIVQLLVTLAALAFYALATGLNPPVVRATFMALVALLGYLTRREQDALSALCLAATAYLVWQPSDVLDVGFQLSFVTVAAFTLFLRPNRDTYPSPLRYLGSQALDVGRTSLVATLASAPIVAFYFGRVPLVGLLANVAIALAVPAVLVVGMGAHLLSYLAPALAGVLMEGPVTWWVAFVERVAAIAASVPGATLSVPQFSAWTLLPVYGLGLMTWRRYVRQP